jgi:hypothetical protein
VHKLPVHCVRCYLIFTSTAELKEHLVHKSKDMCEVTSQHPENFEGFDEGQEKALRARSGASRTDMERWKDMWLILFPDDSESDVPNPCEFDSS